MATFAAGLMATAVDVLDYGLRRAGSGLIAAAVAQSAATAVSARSGYPAWFLLGVLPLALGVLLFGCGRLLRESGDSRELSALCVVGALLSWCASAAIAHQETGAVNVAEPLVGLGAFAAALSGAPGTRPAAVVLVVTHRAGLVIAGTGTVVEHVGMLVWEIGSLLAALIGGLAARRLARPLADAEAQLAAEVRRYALVDLHTVRDRERARVLHDVALQTLTAVGQGGVRDSVVLRRDCARDAAILRGGDPGWQSEGADLDEVLDKVVGRMRAYGLRVHLARDGGRRPQLPATASAALAGALHEALTNVLRHSGVQSCSVTLSATAVSCELAVRDTGRGFPVTDIDGRLGINGSIVARLAEVGGGARIESEPGVGTTVHLRWPVE